VADSMEAPRADSARLPRFLENHPTPPIMVADFRASLNLH